MKYLLAFDTDECKKSDLNQKNFLENAFKLNFCTIYKKFGI